MKINLKNNRQVISISYILGLGKRKLSFLQSPKNIPYIKTPLILFLSISGLSCEKFVDIDPPTTQLAAEKVYQSESTANAVLSYLYVNAGNLANGGSYSASFLGSLLPDEMDIYTTSLSFQQMAGNQMVPTNDYAGFHWQNCYSTIYTANALLEGIKDNPALSEKTIKQLTGEALFIRAMQYLYLTEIYGAVPIALTTNYQLNTNLKQSSQSQVLLQVISDLEQSASLLPADYALYGAERIRPNSFAAKALLARAYLYSEQWQKAEQAANEVIANSALYGLTPLTDVFLKNSKETILSYKPVGIFATNEGGLFILVGKPAVQALKSSFYNGFETGDLRKTNWTGKVTASAIDYYFPSKYKVRTATAYTEYSVVLRLAETYLIRSEALARQDKLSASIADLDVIRFRAGLSKIALTNPSISKTDLLTAILKERRSELFTEWAHRWIDLRRFGKLDETMSAIKTGWQPTAAYWPIPQSELRLNKNLVQNLGY